MMAENDGLEILISVKNLIFALLKNIYEKLDI